MMEILNITRKDIGTADMCISGTQKNGSKINDLISLKMSWEDVWIAGMIFPGTETHIFAERI